MSMTPPITKEWLQQTIAEYEASRDEIPFGLETSSAMELEAFKIALAAMDAEPVAYADPQALINFKSDEGKITARTREWMWRRPGEDLIPLFATPPAPVITSEPVAFINGAWTLVYYRPPEKFGLKIGDKLYAAPPAPVSVSNSSAITQHFDTIALETAREIMCDVNRRHEFLGGEVQLLSRIQCRIDDACRAAMLNHSENEREMVQPVSQAYRLPATRFQQVADLYGITSPTGSETSFTFDAFEASSFAKSGWSVQEYIELERYQQAVTGNSPAIPDGWTGSDEANAALIMLDRIETVDSVDDDRIEGIKRIIRGLAAAPQQKGT